MGTMTVGVERERQRKIAEKELAILARGYAMGKILYKKRGELYER